MTRIDFAHRITTEESTALRLAAMLQLFVYLDGEDVTHDCVEADASQDYVVLLDRDVNGHVYRDPDDPDGAPKRITRLGKVTYAVEFL